MNIYIFCVHTCVRAHINQANTYIILIMMGALFLLWILYKYAPPKGVGLRVGLIWDLS